MKHARASHARVFQPCASSWREARTSRVNAGEIAVGGTIVLGLQQSPAGLLVPGCYLLPS
jgi:hypothetical protein